MKQRRIISAVLAAAFMLNTGFYAYAADYPRKTQESVTGDYTNKTVILHTNDVHGQVEGYAFLPTLEKEFVSRGADVIIVDVGDFSQGDPYVNTTKGQDAVTLMNAAGYDIVTLGNHEFDYGYPQLKSNLEKGSFKVLCADVLQGDKPIYDESYVYSAANTGLKIGFFGMETPETQTKVHPALIEGIRFLSNSGGKTELYDCAQKQVDTLKKNGADVVIALAHLGVDEESATDGHRSVDLYAHTSGMDLILDGHSHTEMTAGLNGEPVQSTGTKFANVGVVVIDNAGKKIEDHYLIPTEKLEKDAVVQAEARKIMDRVDAEYGQVFAASEVDMDGSKQANRTAESPLGDLVSDAMRWSILKNAGSLEVDEDHIVALTNGGTIRASIASGDITKKDINTVLPFGNTLTVVYVTGEQLLEALEASTFCTPTPIGGFPQTCGITFTVDTEKAYDQGNLYEGSTYYAPNSIQRVHISNINGKPFRLQDKYAVVTNDFVAAGGDTYAVFKSCAQFDTGIVLDEIVMEYITEELDGVITAEKYGQVRPVQKLSGSISASDIVKSYSTKEQTVSLKAKAEGGAKLTCKSDNKKVTVDQSGTVTIAAKFSGTAKITITAAETEDYSAASKTVTVTVPTVTNVKSVKGAKAAATVEWKKNSTGTGYEVQYSTDKTFKKGVKTKKISGNKTIKTTIKKLKKGKTYYLRIRTVNAKAYSEWSKSKSVKVK